MFFNWITYSLPRTEFEDFFKNILIINNWYFLYDLTKSRFAIRSSLFISSTLEFGIYTSTWNVGVRRIVDSLSHGPSLHSPNFRTTLPIIDNPPSSRICMDSTFPCHAVTTLSSVHCMSCQHVFDVFFDGRRYLREMTITQVRDDHVEERHARRRNSKKEETKKK